MEVAKIFFDAKKLMVEGKDEEFEVLRKVYNEEYSKLSYEEQKQVDAIRNPTL